VFALDLLLTFKPSITLSESFAKVGSLRSLEELKVFEEVGAEVDNSSDLERFAILMPSNEEDLFLVKIAVLDVVAFNGSILEAKALKEFLFFFIEREASCLTDTMITGEFFLSLDKQLSTKPELSI